MMLLHGMRSDLARIVLVAMVGLHLISCRNPFATRQAEDPFKTDGGLPLRAPNTSKNALENLRVTWEGRSATNYLDVLSEDFVFVPDKIDEESFPQVYQTGSMWDRGREEEFATRLFSRKGAELVLFENWNIEPPELLRSTDGGKNDEYKYHYSIGLLYGAGQAIDAPKHLAGTARIFLRELNGSWFVYRIEDSRTDPTPGTYLGTWGALRARF